MEIKRDTFTITWSAIAAISLLIIVLASCSPIYYTLEGEPVRVKSEYYPECDTVITDEGIVLTK